MNRARRRLLLAAAAAAPAWGQAAPLLRKKIPSSAEEIPVIGLGTARRYERPAPGLRETLQRFGALGGTVVDTAPVYGQAEVVVGDLLEELKLRPQLFLATKVSILGREAGVRQIEQSFQRLRTQKIDLIAVHNLRDTQVHLATLRELKRQARIRYVGITTSSDRQYADFEQTMRREALDFIQVDYALDNRGAGERILPLAAGRGMAMVVNLRELAAVFPKVHRLASRGHVRGAGHGAARICRGQPGRGARPPAGRSHAPPDGKLH